MVGLTTIQVSMTEYSRLKELEGRVNAVRDYVGKSEYVFADNICHMLGLEVSKTIEESGDSYD